MPEPETAAPMVTGTCLSCGLSDWSCEDYRRRLAAPCCESCNHEDDPS